MFASQLGLIRICIVTHAQVLSVDEDLRHVDVLRAGETLLQLALIVAAHEDVALLVLKHVRHEDVAHRLAVFVRLAHYHHARRVHHDLVLLQRAVVLHLQRQQHTYM